jgi:hypothetical protein
MNKVLIFFGAAILFMACDKQTENVCNGAVQHKASFMLMEVLSDTSFEADTVFRDNFVGFKATAQYESVTWQLGSDPRIRTMPSFDLSFYGTLGTIPITFTGNKQPNTTCFPQDNGIYTATRNVTLVEQVDKPLVKISPLRGKYFGAFTDTPSDTFTIRLEYFDSLKYNTQITGAKNFYWLSNFPKGFQGTSNPSYVYPELQDGNEIEMGYTCFRAGSNGQTPLGNVRGHLTKNYDSLIITTGSPQFPYRKFIGIRK